MVGCSLYRIRARVHRGPVDGDTISEVIHDPTYFVPENRLDNSACDCNFRIVLARLFNSFLMGGS